MYIIKIIKKAQKDLDDIRDKLFDKIKEEINFLSKNPRPKGCIKLTNRSEYRIRVGTFRILYEIDDKTKIIWIVRVKHRKESYR